MELNIKSDVQAMETTVISIAKIRIYFETSKFYREFYVFFWRKNSPNNWYRLVFELKIVE